MREEHGESYVLLGRETEIQILGEGIPSINVFEDAHKQERFLGERKFLYNSIPILFAGGAIGLGGYNQTRSDMHTSLCYY